MTARARSFALAIAAGLAPAALAAQSTRLLHQPDVSARDVAFAYAGDIWLVPRDGGAARRVTSSPTVESDPHFSPDGKWLAFTGQYGGNPDVYVVAVDSGTPRRLTYHPGPDLVRGFTPDGQRVVFESTRTGMPDGEPQLWTVPLAGGLPTRLPVPRALYGALSPDGRAIAYQLDRPWESDMRHYRGGQNQPIRVLDVATHAMTRLPWTDSRDQQPAWLGNTIYFISDRGGINNVWAYDTRTKALTQITHYRDFEVQSLNAGAGLVAYEQAGDVHLYDPATGQDRTLDIRVTGDFPWAMPHAADVSKALVNPQLSPSGVRALFEARGDVITVPTDKGTWRDLTPGSGVAHRAPIWSPDGKQIAWFSDSTGEYQLMVGGQDALAPARAYPLERPTYYYDPAWSPDGRKILFTDAELNLWVLDLATGKQTRVDQGNYTWPDRDLAPAWSPDSKWIAYTKRLMGSQFHAAFVYDVAGNAAHQLTDGLSDVIDPTWDRSGKYLLFLASTDFALHTGWLDMSSYNQPVNRGVYLAVLSRSDPSPLLPEPGDEPGDTAKSARPAKPDSAARPPKADSAAVHIDFDGFMQRIVALDVPSRDYANLRAGRAGQFFYVEHVPNHADVLHRYDLEERKAIDFVGAAGEDFALSFDGKKLLYQGATPTGAPSGRWAVVDATGAAPAGDKGALNTANLRIDVDPTAEWRQIFDEAWRIERDYLYVANMNGADWPAVKRKYAQFLPYVKHRADLSTLLSEMQGELTVGHSFVGGGDIPTADALPAGLLGADLDVANGRYRIAKIYSGENWNPSLQAPLSAPGVDVHPGDYILAVDGRTLAPPDNPYAAFIGTVGKQVQLRVNDRPVDEGSHLITVVPIASEMAAAPARLDRSQPPHGRLALQRPARLYLHSRYRRGRLHQLQPLLLRAAEQAGRGDRRTLQPRRQHRRLHGGRHEPRSCTATSASGSATGTTPSPPRRRRSGGPKVLIINEMSGSGGDMFPYMFHQMKIGPLIGTKTWGGLVGWGGEPRFVDGGFISAPSTGFYDVNGHWAVENEGVPPDIEVEQNPAEQLAGHDPQLERAVAEALKLLREHPVDLKPVPPGPDRAHPKAGGGGGGGGGE